MSTSPCHLGPYAVGSMRTERPPPARSVCRSEIVILRRRLPYRRDRPSFPIGLSGAQGNRTQALGRKQGRPAGDRAGPEATAAVPGIIVGFLLCGARRGRGCEELVQSRVLETCRDTVIPSQGGSSVLPTLSSVCPAARARPRGEDPPRPRHRRQVSLCCVRPDRCVLSLF